MTVTDCRTEYCRLITYKLLARPLDYLLITFTHVREVDRIVRENGQRTFTGNIIRPFSVLSCRDRSELIHLEPLWSPRKMMFILVKTAKMMLLVPRIYFEVDTAR